MTKNEKAHLEANYKMHVEHMLKAEDAAKIAAAEKNFKALWAESVEESDPGTAKAIQVQAAKVALTYFIALTRNWMDEVESDLNSRRR